MEQIINTIDANFKYYNIDLTDIWEYEREKFLAGAANLTIAQKIIDLTQRLIVKNGEPSFGEEMREIDPKYYDRNVIDYHQADLKMKYALNYFIFKNDCYEYSQSLLILRNNEDFSFFFSLKLSQYNGKIEEAGSFLQIHLLNTFKDDVIAYRKFLKRLVFQFPTFFQPGLKVEIEEFMSSFESQRIEGSLNGPNFNETEKNRNLKDFMDPGLNSDQTPENVVTKKKDETGNLKNKLSQGISSGNVKENIKIWVGTDTQLDIFYNFVNGVFIENIVQEEFRKHLTGAVCQDSINWIVELNVFIELFDSLASTKKLHQVIVKSNNQLTERGKSVVIISKLISHFKFKGVYKPSTVLNNIRSQFYQSNTIESKFHSEIIEFIEKLKD
jgi:hypothetical protein